MTTDAAPPRVVAPALAPGIVVAERYLLEARLGAGGGGTVWRCHDQKLDATVALKVLTADGDLERWRREVATARRIADRNVCRVHDLGEAGDLRFVTMELVEGAGLRGSVRADLPAAYARALIAQLAAGAAAIHAAGIVHRDLKPENVVVAHDGRAVIVDFGLAREPRAPGEGGGAAEADTVELRSPRAPSRPGSGATVTNAGMIVGTPRYMSPEQAAGDTVDARTDVWALGLIAHELLVGLLPEPDAYGRRIDPRADAKLPGIGAILARCLATDPAARYADARELVAALARLDAPPPPAPVPSPPAPVPVVGRRSRAGLVLGAAAASVLGAVIAAAVWPRGDGTPAPAPPPPPSPSPPPPAAVSAPPAPAPSGRVELRKVVDPVKWPDDYPMSVAVHPDGNQFAYTRVGSISMDLLVGTVDGTRPPIEWPVPRLQRVGDTYPRRLITVHAAGWFRDGSIAVVGSTESDGFALFRVAPDGTGTLLYHQHPRFSVAVARTDRVAIGVNDDGIYTLEPTSGATPAQLVQLGRGEQVLALAWSPDATRLAVARMPAAATEPVRIEVISDGGSATAKVWSGTNAGIYDSFLAWLDDERLAFTQQDPVTRTTRLYTLDTAHPGPPRERAVWSDEYVGIGAIGGGTVLITRGTAYHAVMVGDAKAQHLEPVQPNLRGSYLAGWTGDGRVVFGAGPPGKLRVARARPGRDLEYWPGTREGVELPHTVVGDSVIVARIDPAAPKDRARVIERIGPTGDRVELARIHADTTATPIRCAGDRAGPCVLAETIGNQVVFRELDPARAIVGDVIHQRPIGERYKCDTALSLDGTLLAIVEGRNEVTLFDRTTSAARTWIASADAAMQSVGFSPSGTLWATAIGMRGRLFGAVEFLRDERTGAIKKFPFTRGRTSESALRWLWRASPSPDGTRVAVTVRDFRLHIAQVSGL